MTKIERKCIFCNEFFAFEMNSAMGICSIDKEFEPFVDQIYEDGDCSCCPELYSRKKFDGNDNVCENFSECEIYGDDDDYDFDITEICEKYKLYDDNNDKNKNKSYDDEDDSYDDYEDDSYDGDEEDEIDPEEEKRMIELLEKREYEMKNENLDELAKLLYLGDSDLTTRVLSKLMFYCYAQNKSALKNLIEAYNHFIDIKTINDVHLRLKVLKPIFEFGCIAGNESEEFHYIVDFLVDELYKMPSNNTTRQLFTAILDFLKRNKTDRINEKLIELLKKRKYSKRMHEKILDVYCYAPSGNFWW